VHIGFFCSLKSSVWLYEQAAFGAAAANPTPAWDCPSPT
jgi:hypothetical protein